MVLFDNASPLPLSQCTLLKCRMQLEISMHFLFMFIFRFFVVSKRLKTLALVYTDIGSGVYRQFKSVDFVNIVAA